MITVKIYRVLAVALVVQKRVENSFQLLIDKSFALTRSFHVFHFNVDGRKEEKALWKGERIRD